MVIFAQFLAKFRDLWLDLTLGDLLEDERDDVPTVTEILRILDGGYAPRFNGRGGLIVYFPSLDPWTQIRPSSSHSTRNPPCNHENDPICFIKRGKKLGSYYEVALFFFINNAN